MRRVTMGFAIATILLMSWPAATVLAHSEGSHHENGHGTAGHDRGRHKEAGHSVAGHHDGDGEPVTLTGEVMDLACYMQHPHSSKGKAHARCGQSCVSKGLPAGFLVGGDMYLLLAPGHDPVSDLVAEYVGTRVTITGRRKVENGMKAIVVEGVSEVK